MFSLRKQADTVKIMLQGLRELFEWSFGQKQDALELVMLQQIETKG